mmetsp:Transcript_19420/g.55682  ORF Transcript_19420/g.55682 Transcript_19420/m.55682 type:complete len:178 (-) Transcript_19420:392-925(-)
MRAISCSVPSHHGHRPCHLHSPPSRRLNAEEMRGEEGEGGLWLCVGQPAPRLPDGRIGAALGVTTEAGAAAAGAAWWGWLFFHCLGREGRRSASGCCSRGNRGDAGWYGEVGGTWPSIASDERTINKVTKAMAPATTTTERHDTSGVSAFDGLSHAGQSGPPHPQIAIEKMANIHPE